MTEPSGSGSFEGRHYMVMEWCEGRDLKSREDYFGDELIGEGEARLYMRQVCDALIYLQHKNRMVIYKDLKPSNIIVNQYGRIKLIDFGTARHFSPEKNRDTMILGTPGYAAPEAYTGVQTNLSADVYSFGATFYHLLTGEEPFQFKFNFPDPRTFNPNLSGEISELLLDCLKNRNERIKDAFQLRKRVYGINMPVRPVPATLKPYYKPELLKLGEIRIPPMALPAIMALGLFLLILSFYGNSPEYEKANDGCLASLIICIITLFISTYLMYVHINRIKRINIQNILSYTLSDTDSRFSILIFLSAFFVLLAIMLILYNIIFL